VSEPIAGHDVAAVAVEVAQHGVGEFAVDLDVLLAADGVPRQPVGRPGVAEQADEEVGQKIRQQLLLLEAVDPAAVRIWSLLFEGAALRCTSLPKEPARR
jgi:hypothetical protein